MKGDYKFVVLHSLIGGEFTRGQVVPEDKLGDSIQRFLDLKAIRLATDAEAECERVDIDPARPNPSAQQKIADKHAEVERLESRVKEQNAQIADMTAQLESAKTPSATPPKPDPEIERLQALVKELEAVNKLLATPGVPPAAAPPAAEDKAATPKGAKK